MRCLALTILSSLFFLLSSQGKPNIIFLLTDDQTVYSIGAYGNKDVKTPHMDQLVAEGVLFNRHYNTTAICMASRAIIFTGKYEYKTGTNFQLPINEMKADLWNNSYPVLLRKGGYLTAFAGKFGLEVEGKGICAQEFDFYGGGKGQTSYKTAANQTLKKYKKEYPHATLAYGAFGKDVIKDSVKAQKPFCLSISFKAPHKPATPDPRFDEIYKGKTFTKPPNYGRKHGEHMSLQSKQGRQHSRFESWDYDKDYDGVMATYHQQIYAVDVALGMLRKELEAQGVADNTVIIFTSDNGFICGAHGYGSKVLPMEEASRAPLIILDPRTKNKGLRSSKLTASIDMAPTILEIAELPIPSKMDGKSLLPLLNEQPEGVHDQIAFMNTWANKSTTSLTVITEQHKYTYWWYEGKDMKPMEELYDLKADPYELTNLASTKSDLLAQMQTRYDAELAKWEKNAVDYNHYQDYVTLFNRSIPMSKKTALLQK